MEILIIGIIVVGLMVYVSTKIKNTAKAAYEREIFDGGDFSIVKPAGFLIPVRENSPFVFEANSKEFGEDEARDLYRCAAVVTEKSGAENTSETEGELTESNVKIRVYRKTLADRRNNKSYELEIKVLPEFAEEFAERIGEMKNTFALKIL